MTFEERLELRQRIDEARRRRVLLTCERGYENPETGYKAGCRCDFCRAGTSEARKARQARRDARRAAA